MEDPPLNGKIQMHEVYMALCPGQISQIGCGTTMMLSFMSRKIIKGSVLLGLLSFFFHVI